MGVGAWIIIVLIVLFVVLAISGNNADNKRRKKLQEERIQRMKQIINSENFQKIEKEILSLGDLGELKTYYREKVYCYYYNEQGYLESRRVIESHELPSASEFVDAFFFKYQNTWEYIWDPDEHVIRRKNPPVVKPTEWK